MIVTIEETKTTNDNSSQSKNLTILLTQLSSGQERITHLINTSSTLLLPVTRKCQDLNLWFVDGVVWPVVKVVAGPGAASLGESLHLVDMLAVLLIIPIITLGMYVTVKMFRNARFLLIHLAGEVAGGTETILRQGQDIMASVSAGLAQPPIVNIRVVTLARVLRITSSALYS